MNTDKAQAPPLHFPILRLQPLHQYFRIIHNLLSMVEHYPMVRRHQSKLLSFASFASPLPSVCNRRRHLVRARPHFLVLCGVGVELEPQHVEVAVHLAGSVMIGPQQVLMGEPLLAINALAVLSTSSKIIDLFVTELDPWVDSDYERRYFLPVESSVAVPVKW